MQHKPSESTELFAAASPYKEEWNAVHQLLRNAKIAQQTRWQPPSPGVIKLNFDGAQIWYWGDSEV